MVLGTCNFDFSAQTVKPLVQLIRAELEKLEKANTVRN